MFNSRAFFKRFISSVLVRRHASDVHASDDDARAYVLGGVLLGGVPLGMDVLLALDNQETDSLDSQVLLGMAALEILQGKGLAQMEACLSDSLEILQDIVCSSSRSLLN